MADTFSVMCFMSCTPQWYLRLASLNQRKKHMEREVKTAKATVTARDELQTSRDTRSFPDWLGTAARIYFVHSI